MSNTDYIKAAEAAEVAKTTGSVEATGLTGSEKAQQADQMISDEQKFFAMLDRTRYIQRWALMRNNEVEDVAQHSYQVAVIAQALSIIRRQRFWDLSPQTDPEFVMTKAIYHDASEVITGDLPTPVKYHSSYLKKSYKELEKQATKDLLQMLPEDLRSAYAPYLFEPDISNLTEDSPQFLAAKQIKAADKISAYIKCLVEVNQGNNEFREAKASTLNKIEEFYAYLPEVQVFMEEFIPAYYLSLDDLKSKNLASFQDIE